jgi:hypothetical protein
MIKISKFYVKSPFLYVMCIFKALYPILELVCPFHSRKIIAKVITSVGGFIKKMADYEQGLKGIVIHNQSLEFELVMNRSKTLVIWYFVLSRPT